MTNTISNSKRTLLGLAGAATLALPLSQFRNSHAANFNLKPIDQPEDANDESFIARAFDMRQQAIDNGDQSYGAVVVRDGIIVGQAPSRVVTSKDPTAHAEMEAIRDAALRLGTRDLSECTLYSSSPACSMCEAAAYWARIDRLVYGQSINDKGQPSLCG